MNRLFWSILAAFLVYTGSIIYSTHTIGFREGIGAAQTVFMIFADEETTTYPNQIYEKSMKLKWVMVKRDLRRLLP